MQRARSPPLPGPLEKFLKIALGTEQKGLHGSQMFFAFVFLFSRKGKPVWGDGGSKLALSMLFAFRSSLGSLRWLLTRKRENMPSNMCVLE